MISFSFALSLQSSSFKPVTCQISSICLRDSRIYIIVIIILNERI